MDRPQALVTAFLMVAVTLAGCSSGGEQSDEPFSAKVPADPSTQPFVFTANEKGDDYRWDLGDGTIVEGEKKVEHTYGFTDGIITVRLTVVRDGEEFRFSRQFLLGTGENAPPALVYDVATDWVTVGEAFRLSGAASSDPDGDPLLFAWACKRLGDLTPSDGHGHAHGGGTGVPLGAHFLATRVAEIGAADHTVEGDFCAANPHDAAPAFTRQATVEGSFQETGVYQVRMLGKDPKSSVFVGHHVIFVTEEKPPAEEVFTFSHDLNGGYQGNVQDNVGDVEELLGEDTGESFDRYVHSFRVQLPNKGGSPVSFAFTTPADGSPAVVPEVAYEIGTPTTPSAVVAKTNEPETLLEAGELKNGFDYQVSIVVEQGASINYTLTLTNMHDMDPHHLYQEPTG